MRSFQWKVYFSFLQYQQKIMIASKKKSDLPSVLDDLRCEDPKKRLAAVIQIKEVASALGASRVRSELIAFLAQFVDDQQHIVLQLLTQIEGFTPLLGGPEHLKSLVPLLISFCKTDEKKSAMKACAQLLKILTTFKELAVESIRKLIKTDMNVSRQCGTMLIAGLLPVLEGQENVLMQLFLPLYNIDSPQIKIICAKYLQQILKGVKNKQEIGKILQTIYNEGQELVKIYAIPALIDYYDVSNNFCLTKFKNLSVINSWRINIKICDNIQVISKKVTKPHFKLIFEPTLLKYMASIEPQLRAASCQSISALCKNMAEDQLKTKLFPIVKKLSTDPVDYVKIQLSKSIVPVCALVNSEVMNESVLPIIFSFVKDPVSEITVGVIQSFQYLATRMPKETLEQKIIKPLLGQLSTENWRIKCEILEILRVFFINQAYLSDGVLKVFFGLTDDKIDAVRLKANELIVEIIAKSSKEWCDQYVIPKISGMKDSATYIKRQNILDLIERTAPHVSEKALKEHYHNVVATFLGDKVPNVRLKGVMVIKNNNKLLNSVIQKQLQKLKEDKDNEVRQVVKKLRA